MASLRAGWGSERGRGCSWKVCGGAISLVRLRLQGLEDNALNGGRNAGNDTTRGGWTPLYMHRNQGNLVFRDEGEASRDHLIQQHAQRIEVAAHIGLAIQLE